MNWKVGDRAVIIQSRFPERVGQHVIIMSELTAYSKSTGCLWRDGQLRHLVDLPSLERPDLLAAYQPEYLGPIPDDKHKRFHEALISTDWSRCAFNPMVEIEQ